MTTIDKVVATSGDDGRRATGSSGFAASETGYFVGYIDNPDHLHCHMFARWTGITIPSGATITAAYIKWYFVLEEVDHPELKVYGVDEDNPAAPVSAAEFDADALTTAAVDWDGPFDEGWNQSPELKTIIQELVDSYTISNVALMVQVKHDGTEATHYVYPRYYDSDPSYPPELHIEYTTAEGWTGKIMGVTNPAKIMGIDVANIAKVMGV